MSIFRAIPSNRSSETPGGSSPLEMLSKSVALALEFGGDAGSGCIRIPRQSHWATGLSWQNKQHWMLQWEAMAIASKVECRAGLSPGRHRSSQLLIVCSSPPPGQSSRSSAGSGPFEAAGCNSCRRVLDAPDSGLRQTSRPTASAGCSRSTYDHAPMEPFFATLKKELVHHEQYQTRAEARHSLFEDIEVFDTVSEDTQP